MPTYTPKRLAQNAQASTSETTVYTVPGATSAIVKHIIIANTTGSAANYSISIVPSAGSATAANRILETVSFAANSITSIPVMIQMDTGDFISIKQGTSAAITVTINGVTYV